MTDNIKNSPETEAAKPLHKILDDIAADLKAAGLTYNIGPYWYQEVNIQVAEILRRQRAVELQLKCPKCINTPHFIRFDINISAGLRVICSHCLSAYPIQSPADMLQFLKLK